MKSKQELQANAISKDSENFEKEMSYLNQQFEELSQEGEQSDD